MLFLVLMQFKLSEDAEINGNGDCLLWEFIGRAGKMRKWKYDPRVRVHDNVTGTMFRAADDGGMRVACPRLEVT